ncbi:type II toxin-antitoxin system RelE/ParE family toxin [Ralstonia solanacearum]
MRLAITPRYVIFFVTTPDEVIVIRILHGARDLPAVFHANEP